MSIHTTTSGEDVPGISNITVANTISNNDYSSFTIELLKPSQSRHDRQRIVGGSDSGISDDLLSISEEPEKELYGTQPPTGKRKLIRKIVKYSRQIILGICWLTITTCLMMYPEEELESELLTVTPIKNAVYKIKQDLEGNNLILKLVGPFNKTTYESADLQAAGDNQWLALTLQEVEKERGSVRNVSATHHLLVATNESFTCPFIAMETIIEDVAFDPHSFKYQLLLFTNTARSLPLEIALVSPGISAHGIIIWGLSLLGLIYVFVMFDMVHTTFAAAVSCSLVISILAAVNLVPNISEIFQFIDMDLIMSFFAITVIMELLGETGLQDYLAALSYEMANGHIWPLLNVLFLASCSLSTIFGDITLILFLAPICLRLCEIMHLHCTPVLSCLIIAINVGSTLTPVSSVTNNLIYNHPAMAMHNISFGSFTLHMFPATLLTLAQSYIHLRLQFIDSTKIGTKEPIQVERLKRLTRLWRKVSDRMGGYSLDERTARDTVDTRIRSLRKRLKRLGKMPIPPKDFEEKVQKLRGSFPIQKKPLMMACLLAIAISLLLSMLCLLTKVIDIGTGWLAILAAVLAVSLCNYKDIEGVLSRIDWTSMLYFACLFIFVQVLIKLRFNDYLGLFIERLITNAEEKHRLTVAIVSITWISAGLSTLMNNAAIVNMMIDIITTISFNKNLRLPPMPLVWSVALGCGLGGNGTIMAAVVNIAGAGMASKHGYKITYFGYLKIGFFVMVGNVVVATCYLLLAYVVGHWN